MLTKQVKIKQFDVASKKVTSNSDFILIDQTLFINYPDNSYKISTTFDHIDDLVQGLSYIQSGNLKKLLISQHEDQISVNLKSELLNVPSPIDITSINIQHDHIVTWLSEFRDQQRLYHQTGATVAVGVPTNDQMLVMECVSPLSCYSKLIGSIVRNDQTYHPIIFCSHPIRMDTLDLILALKPEIIVSQSAISSGVLDALISHNITVFGFCRKRKYNRYSNFHI